LFQPNFYIFAKQIIVMKKKFLVIFFASFLTQAQQIDSLKTETSILENKEVQSYKINSDLSFEYKKPRFWEFINRLPKDFSTMGSLVVQKNNLIFGGISVVSTVALLPVDQKIIDNSRQLGQQIGIEDGHDYFGPLKFIPRKINGGIYNLGNGFTSILLAGGILTFGLIEKDYRAIHTASEVGEGLLASGVFVQTIKRITGRESPFVAEEYGHKGGDWNPFPSFNAYATATPAYDAVPSGHLSTFMTTFVIISENYKEKKWIKPVGYSMMGLLCFEMLQSKVHWASDYPIAVFMGYIVGKSIVKNRIVEKTTKIIGDHQNFKPKFNYSFNSDRNFTLAGMSITF
jgi:PAP2 superfamily